MMKQTKKPLINLTHIEDLDGIGSQAILLRKFPDLICKRTFYPGFIENIKKIYIMTPYKLYITDIGFNESYKEVFDILSEMETCWIDHHSISDSNELELKKHVKNFIHSNVETVAAAELTQRLFLPNDNIAKKIAKMAHYRDNSIEDQESERFQSIIEMNLKNNVNLQKFVEFFSKGDFKNSWFHEQYAKYLELEKIEFGLLEKRAIEYKIKNNKIIFSFSFFFQTGKQTRHLMKKFGADIAFGINPGYHVVSIRSQKIDSSKIAKEFGGGGHQDRAGFPYLEPLDENNSLSDQFIAEVLKVVERILMIPQQQSHQ